MCGLDTNSNFALQMKDATDKAERISNETGIKLAQLDKTLRNISVGFLDVKKDVDTAGKVIDEASNLTETATQVSDES